jgi:hypothetical protein
MTKLAEHNGLTLTDAPTLEHINFIVEDSWGNNFPISDQYEMENMEQLLAKFLSGED